MCDKMAFFYKMCKSQVGVIFCLLAVAGQAEFNPELIYPTTWADFEHTDGFYAIETFFSPKNLKREVYIYILWF